MRRREARSGQVLARVEVTTIGISYLGFTPIAADRAQVPTTGTGEPRQARLLVFSGAIRICNEHRDTLDWRVLLRTPGNLFGRDLSLRRHCSNGAGLGRPAFLYGQHSKRM